MKQIIIILIALFLISFKVSDNIKIGMTYTQVEAKAIGIQFKYYNKTLPMSFGLIGCWNKENGSVYQFSNDTLIHIQYFKKYMDYAEYLYNPKMKKFILLDNVYRK